MYYTVEFAKDYIKIRKKNGDSIEMIDKTRSWNMSKGVWYQVKLDFKGGKLNVFAGKEKS
jgi:hypothetical protein